MNDEVPSLGWLGTGRMGAARSLEVPMPVAASVHQLIQSAIGIGLRDEDFLSLYDQQARGAGLNPKAREE